MVVNQTQMCRNQVQLFHDLLVAWVALPASIRWQWLTQMFNGFHFVGDIAESLGLFFCWWFSYEQDDPLKINKYKKMSLRESTPQFYHRINILAATVRACCHGSFQGLTWLHIKPLPVWTLRWLWRCMVGSRVGCFEAKWGSCMNLWWWEASILPGSKDWEGKSFGNVLRWTTGQAWNNSSGSSIGSGCVTDKCRTCDVGEPVLRQVDQGPDLGGRDGYLLPSSWEFFLSREFPWEFGSCQGTKQGHAQRIGWASEAGLVFLVKIESLMASLVVQMSWSLAWKLMDKDDVDEMSHCKNGSVDSWEQLEKIYACKGEWSWCGLRNFKNSQGGRAVCLCKAPWRHGRFIALSRIYLELRTVREGCASRQVGKGIEYI